MIYLRQSTASQEVPLGFFVDSTDGNTEETGLTIANTDIKIWKTGATALANKNSGGGTHISNGIYYCVLDATDTNTIGPGKIFVHVAGALPVEIEICVLDEAVYDVLFGTVAPLVSGTNAGTTTFGALTVTGATTLTGNVNLSANLNVAGESLLGVGVTVSGGVSVDGALVVGGATTFQAVTIAGAFTATNASNNIVGIDVAKISGDATAADNLELFFDGTGYNAANSTVGTVTLVTTLTTYTGNTVQTGDSYAIVNNGSHGNAAIKGYVDDIGIAGAGLTALGDSRLANLDAAVTTRMATYTQPTGFLAATFPTTIASTTNITAASGVALTSAYDFAKGTVAMTESYNADGSAPTPVQALFVATQYLLDKSIVGTTVTVKKIDGTTTAYTATLDSATVPTSIARAT